MYGGIFMHNSRGAGRKPQITKSQMDDICFRIEHGESVSVIAQEYGVSRQALYQRLKAYAAPSEVVLDYFYEGELASRLFIDVSKEKIRVENISKRVSTYAFGLNKNPEWEDLRALFEHTLLQSIGVESDIDETTLVVDGNIKRQFSIHDLLEKTAGVIELESPEFIPDAEPIFELSKKNILFSRTDTDGFQLKAISDNRRWFIKAQAIISGVLMDDWAVEIIASDICSQLNINCVQQRKCHLVYGPQKLIGVYSINFELDGYEFISFESLIGRIGLSTSEQEFIHLDAMSKLEWCANKLAIVGNLPYEETLNYMIDLGLIDCLVGNVDRHTRNFGLFFDSINNVYLIPPLFDNGMGLFEHDYYKEKYNTYQDAMMRVCISPYGEDPFDMIDMLNDKYDLSIRYPELRNLQYKKEWTTPFAERFMEEMTKKVQSYF